MHFYSTFRATNSSGTACQIRGFFGAAGYNGETAVFTNTDRQGTAQVHALAPGESVKFTVITATGDKAGRACTNVTNMHVTPPNQRPSVTISLGRTISACATGQGTTNPTVTAPQ